MRPGASEGRSQHKAMALGGTVISATFTVPQLLQYREGSEWELNHRDGHSAHMDALCYLSSEASPWNHTVIGWTGEIGRVSDDASLALTPRRASISAATLPSWKEFGLQEAEVIVEDISLTNSSREKLEELLYNDYITTIPVWLAGEGETVQGGRIVLHQQSRWRRYAEHDICALFHYKQHPPTDGPKADARWKDYYRMNEAFADKVSQVYKAGDVIMVHDYYLMLLPEMLRQRHPNIHILFFLESPFPSSELMRCLHRREELLRGVLEADLICFQTFHYAQHFASSCSRILGYLANNEWVESPRRRVGIGLFPAGINVSNLLSRAFNDAVEDKVTQLAKLHKGYKIIVGCDLLDRLGGVDKKLQAFQCFLERYPKWRDNVVLIQIMGPVTIEDDGGDNATYTRKVNELAGTINQTYGSLGFNPVQIHSQQLSQDEYLAVLRLGDVALNTCVREGLSTTSMEYVACQRNREGVLIISEFSGTASNMPDAIKVNPWDSTQVADQIYNALTMGRTQRKRVHKGLYDYITSGNVEHYVSSMLQSLVQIL
ncbi:Trehalose-phosphatase [Metarhizium anisopliae]|nr:Trehalose-phosphatase [Metarhizium anisopliae]